MEQLLIISDALASCAWDWQATPAKEEGSGAGNVLMKLLMKLREDCRD